MAVDLGQVRFSVGADTKGLDAALRKLREFEDVTERVQGTARKFTTGVNNASRATTRQASEVDRAQRALRSFDSSLGGARRAEAQFANAQDKLNRALKAGIINQEQFNQRMDEARQRFSTAEVKSRDLRSSMQRLGGAVTNARNAFAALAGVLAIREMAQFVQTALGAAESIADVAKQANVSATSLQGLRRAFDQNGGSAEKMDQALIRFNRRLGLAAEGTGAAKDTFGELGVAIRDSRGNLRDTEDVLRDAIDAIADMDDASRQAAQASELFGEDAGPRLVPLLKQGSGAIDDYVGDLRELRTLFENDIVNSAGSASAALRRVTEDIQRAFQIGFLEGFTDSTEDLTKSLEELVKVANQAGLALGEVTNFIVENRAEIAAAAAAFAAFRVAGAITAALPAGPQLKALINLLAAAGAGIAAFQAESAKASESVNLLAQDLNFLQKQVLPIIESSESLAEAQKRLAEEAGDGIPADAVRAFLSNFENIDEAAKAAREGIKKLKGELGDLGGRLNIVPEGGKNAADGIQRMRIQLGGLFQLSERTIPEVERLGEQVKRQRALMEQAGDATEDNSAALSFFADRTQVAAAGTQLVLDRLEQLGGGPTAGGIGFIGPTIEGLKKAQEEADKLGKDASDALDEPRKKVSELEREIRAAFDEAERSIQRTFADTFVDVLDGNIDSFADFGDEIIDIWKRTIAEIAAATVTANITPVTTEEFGGCPA